MPITLYPEKQSTHAWWRRLRPKLTVLYLVIALLLLLISGTGHIRLLGEVGKVFGSFTWTIDPDSKNGDIVIIATPPQLPPFAISADSLTSSTHITTVNGISGPRGIEQAYRQAHPNDAIRYTIQGTQTPRQTTFTRPAIIFSLDMWWQTYGLTLFAGASWLIVGIFLLATASEWTGAVEGMTMLPPAILLLLYSHWGNIQTATFPDHAIQFLWIPSFALLGAAFIHLSLTYQPEAMSKVRTPGWLIDGLPYVPVLLIIICEWLAYALLGHVPMRLNILVSLGYGVAGGIISFCIGLTSLLHIVGLRPLSRKNEQVELIAPRIRHYLGDLLALWIGGVGLGFCLGVLPILLTGQTLLPLPIFYTLATVYPLILLYAIRSLRLIARLHITLDQREEALLEQQRTADTLQKTNNELQQATSLLLHADAHLRSILSQRIHDQPKQQALRIRSLLGHWQHKLRIEMEREGDDKVTAKPIIDALSKIRKISEELEGDLRGLQMLVEDAYQRRSLGLKLHLEKLIHEDLPMLHQESPLQVQADLWALDALDPDLEQSEEGEKIAEAVSYTITQALLNIYNHAGANYATVRTYYLNGILEIQIQDDGKGFDPQQVPLEKTSLFKARLKAREAHGSFTVTSMLRPQSEHGTTIRLQIPLQMNINQTTMPTQSEIKSKT